MIGRALIESLKIAGKSQNALGKRPGWLQAGRVAGCSFRGVGDLFPPLKVDVAAPLC